MKKSKIVTIIIVAIVVVSIATVSVITFNALQNNSKPPTVWDKVESDYVDSYQPTEKDSMRIEIATELRKKKDKIYQEMVDSGKDKKTAYNEASEQVLLERISEIADILKKYNKVDSGFEFRGIDDNVTGMRAACELLNSSENLTVREIVILEMYLEEGYYTLRELGGHDDLMNNIKNTVTLPY